MKATSNKMAVSIAKAISQNLAFRYSADRFFAFIEAMKPHSIIIDFRGVSTISRSFAHQYMLRKNQSSKDIYELNVPRDVAKMFLIVQQPKTETIFVELAEIRPLEA